MPATNEERLQEQRRRSFDAVAATYARYLPQYPAAAFELITCRLARPRFYRTVLHLAASARA